MMSQAFYTGISGIQNNSIGIDVIANNIANVSTVGFRGYDTEFASLFGDALTNSNGSTNTIGSGVRVQTTSMIKSQGVLALSDRSTDLAILGNGWFGVQAEGKPVYTRDGSFTFDSNSDLVTNDGYYVLGTVGGNISKDNILTSQINQLPLSNIDNQQKLRFPKTLTFPPQPSKKVQFFANLGVGKDPITVGSTVVDPKNNNNNLSLLFRRNAVQTPPGSQYSVIATTKSADGTKLYDTKTGVVNFDAAGSLINTSLTTIDNNGVQVAIDLGSNFNGITAINRPYAPGSSKADGTIGGDLVGYNVNKNAEVIATFTNGRQSSVGKIAVYHFRNEQSLDRVNGTRFKESPNSGKAHFYTDANGKSINGVDVLNYKLEGSNITLTSGLTELITLQRAYDANSKSISTANQMIKKALDM